MKQEIYVKEMPKSCLGCKFFVQHRRQCEIELGFEWSEEEQKYNDCPLKSLHNHDKELVEKVLEKVKKKLNNISMHTNTKERLMIMCEEIQKDFENGKI